MLVPVIRVSCLGMLQVSWINRSGFYQIGGSEEWLHLFILQSQLVFGGAGWKSWCPFFLFDCLGE